MVCRAQQQNAGKAAAAAVSLPALLAAQPALALVDDRLVGEGTGLIFGINDPSLFWVIAAVFTTVWAIYYVSSRDLDQGENVSCDRGGYAVLGWRREMGPGVVPGGISVLLFASQAES
jgi:photosystem II PsbW protein